MTDLTATVAELRRWLQEAPTMPYHAIVDTVFNALPALLAACAERDDAHRRMEVADAHARRLATLLGRTVERPTWCEDLACLGELVDEVERRLTPQTGPCPSCLGDGLLRLYAGQTTKCGHCDGTGRVTG